MKTILLKVAGILYSGLFALSAIQAQGTYNKVIGNTGSDLLREHVLNDDGSLYAAGRHNGRAALYSLNDCGEVNWVKEYTFSGVNITTALAIAKAPNGDLILGNSFNENWYVWRTDASGNVIWSNIYSNIRERFIHLAVDHNGNIFLGGWYSLGSSSDDIAILKLDGNGTQIWSKRYHKADDQLYDIVPNGNGGLVMTGGLHSNKRNIFLLEIDGSGAIINRREMERTGGLANFEGMTITPTSDGGYALICRAGNSFSTINFASVLKVDGAFNTVWKRDYNTNGLNGVFRIQEASNGHLYASFRTTWSGTAQYTIVEHDANGNFIQAKAFDNLSVAVLNNVDQADQNIIVVGQTNAPTFGSLESRVISMGLNLDICGSTTVTPITASISLVNRSYNPVTYNQVWGVTSPVGNAINGVSQYADDCGMCMNCPELDIFFASDCEVVYPGVPGFASTTLSVTSTTGGTAPYSYVWSNGDIGASTTVSPATNTTYYVTATDNNGCTQTDSVCVVAVDVLQQNGNNPNIKVVMCHNGNTISVSINAMNTLLGNGASLGPCDENGNPTDPCAGKSAIRTSGKIATGSMKLEVLPNISNSYQNIQVNYRLPRATRATIELYALTGERVSTIVPSGMAEGQQTASIAPGTLSPGTYIVVLQTANGRLQQRLVVQ